MYDYDDYILDRSRQYVQNLQGITPEVWADIPVKLRSTVAHDMFHTGKYWMTTVRSQKRCTIRDPETNEYTTGYRPSGHKFMAPAFGRRLQEVHIALKEQEQQA